MVVKPVKRTNVRGVTFVVALITVLVSSCDRSDILQSNYSTYEAAVQDGAIARGWIPEFLPCSAEQIREIHNIDMNETWLSFDFAEGDRATLTAACASITAVAVSFPRNRSTKNYVPWWPQQLRGQAPVADAGFTFYRCEEKNLSNRFQAYLALERARSKAWFWRYRSY